MSYAELRGVRALPAPAATLVGFLVRWTPLGIIVGLWEVASGTVVPRAILSPPSAVFGRMWGLLASGEILPHLIVSLWRVALGLALAITFGVLVGVAMARIQSVENFFDVFLTLIYPIPKTALVPLAILWLGSGTESAAFIVFLACLLPIVMNSYNAAGAVDQNLIWSARMMGTSGRAMLRKVVIPASIPEIMTGIRQAMPISFVALVSAELIAADEGIGYLIISYGNLGIYDSMFAVIVIFSTVSYAGVRGFEQLEERVLVWT
ncbi:MAG: ABC transporter permease [Halobacteriales archaeon]